MRLVLPSNSLPTPPHKLFATVPTRARPIRHLRLAIVALIWAGVTTSSAPTLPPPTSGEPFPAIQSLSAEPASILLHGANRQQQLLVTAKPSSGPPIDVTHRCEITSSDTAVAALSGSVVTSVSKGTAEIRIRLGSRSAIVPVQVRDSGFPPVHFANDIMPLFSKLGCNSAGCHGKASGQNGFKLSVFGFDPDADYAALVKESRGRRVFPSAPEQSLLLVKPTGKIAHGGGQRIDPRSTDYLIIREWLKQGTPVGEKGAPRAVSLRVTPAERILGLKAEQQILATVVFSDGTERDVTAAAGYTSNASHVAEVDSGGRVRTGQTPGEVAITVHYMGHVAVVRFQVPRPGGPNPYPAIPTNNTIDELVWAKLKTIGILPSELASDAVFLRRVYLDVLGILPRPSEVLSFLEDPDPDKRAKWIDMVLNRPEYADYWAQKWADLLLVNHDKLGDRGSYEMHRWLRSQFAHNRPYDQWVRELIVASGLASQVGPVNFFRASGTPEVMTRAVSQAFLGIRLECAQCHHHPFEKWAQADFYGLAGFFNGMQLKKLPSGDELVYHLGNRPMKMPLTDQVVTVRPPDGPALASTEEGDPRQRLADWMTKPENPWFARLVVNRLWKHYLGRGLVEPEDDLRSTNPSTNEPLLDHLTKTLVTNKYDLKAVTRLILQSRVYQLSSVPNATNKDDEQYSSHYRVKRLPAEVLLDAICTVTESPESFPGRPIGTRAIELWDNRAPSYFLDIFGRSERLSPCECGRSSEPTMAQCLHLMNAPEIERKLAAPGGRIVRLFGKKQTEEQIVEELCLAALGRPSGEKERRAARKLFASEPPREAAQDFLWALLNSHDFLFTR